MASSEEVVSLELPAPLGWKKYKTTVSCGPALEHSSLVMFLSLRFAGQPLSQLGETIFLLWMTIRGRPVLLGQIFLRVLLQVALQLLLHVHFAKTRRQIEVIGGTMIENGCLLVKATHVGSETALSQIVQLVEAAKLARVTG